MLAQHFISVAEMTFDTVIVCVSVCVLENFERSPREFIVVVVVEVLIPFEKLVVKGEKCIKPKIPLTILHTNTHLIFKLV